MADGISELTASSVYDEEKNPSALLFLKMCSHIPNWCIAVVCETIGVLAFLLARKEVRRIQTNILHVLGIPEGSRDSQVFAYQCLKHQAYVLFETLCMSIKTQRIQFSGLETLRSHVHQAESEGNGFAIVTAHLGNWELVGHSTGIASRMPFYALAKPSPSKWFTAVLHIARRLMKIQILWTGSKSILSEMLTVLRKQQGLGFVMDQKPDSRMGHPCRFLGIPVHFVGGPALVVAKTNCAVISVFCIRRGIGQYELFSERLFAGGIQPQDQLELTTAFADKIGEMIRKEPAQWLWNYRRWKTEDLLAHGKAPKAPVEVSQ